jgi:peptidoglycan hydrolase-like protein with peptidoglycan-binding domain
MARRAKATAVLLEQVNVAAPNRNKSSDGWIGDTAHAARASDHNPNSAGVVQAQDITHDPAGGFDSYKFAEYLRNHKDKRIKYVISNRKIFAGASGPSAWTWRPYTGSNPHDHHVHVSVSDSAKLYDDTAPWDIAFTLGLPDTSAPDITLPVLKQGAKGYYVTILQVLLGFAGSEVDGDFGKTTDLALKQFQRSHKLDIDGVCGMYSWRELLRPWARQTLLLPTDPKQKLVEMAAVARQTGSTASVEDRVAAYLALLQDSLPPGFVLEKVDAG